MQVNTVLYELTVECNFNGMGLMTYAIQTSEVMTNTRISSPRFGRERELSMAHSRQDTKILIDQCSGMGKSLQLGIR
jgi:hypothetical protein